MEENLDRGTTRPLGPRLCTEASPWHPCHEFLRKIARLLFMARGMSFWRKYTNANCRKEHRTGRKENYSSDTGFISKLFCDLGKSLLLSNPCFPTCRLLKLSLIEQQLWIRHCPLTKHLLYIKECLMGINIIFMSLTHKFLSPAKNSSFHSTFGSQSPFKTLLDVY